MTDKPLNSVLEGGALTRAEFRDQFLVPLNDFVGQLAGGAAESELTISSGSVTPTGASHLVDTESDAAADDLTHIQVTNLPAGSYVQLGAVDAGRVPTLKHGSGGSGQMLLARDSDAVLDDIDKRIWLQRVGTDWVERWRSWPVATDLPLSLTLSGVISPSQLTANQNNYSPTGLANATTLRLTSDAARTVTGLVPGAGAGGRVIVIENVGTNPIVLANQSASSTAANRFLLGGDLTLQPDESTMLLYDATSSRWRPAGKLPLFKSLPRVEVTDDVTIGAAHWGRMVVLTAATGSVDKDANLPAAASNAAQVVGIMNEDADDAFIIDPNSTELVDGEATVSLAQGEWRVLWCDGTGWISLASSGASGAAVDVQNFTASGTWNKPSSGTIALLEAWGGGGAGEKYSNGGGGGGGGAYTLALLPLSALGSSETITIGAGGTATAGNGNDGGTTTIGSLLTAYGGEGGGGGGDAVAGGGGGALGVGSAGVGGAPGGGAKGSNSGGSPADSMGGGGGGGGGSSSSAGGAAYWGGGGGGPGGSAGSSGPGGASVYGGGGGGGGWNGSAGGASTHGGDGSAGSASGTATAGSQPGGGGGGTRTGTAGAGGAGQVRITVW